MRDAADHVDAEVERPLEIGHRAGGAEIAVLREGDELQVESVSDEKLNRSLIVQPDGTVSVDGRRIYTAEDLRVGLFTSTEGF